MCAVVWIGIATWVLLPAQHRECANSISCITDLTAHVENNTPGVFDNQKVMPPPINVAITTNQAVLGATTDVGKKHIYVDLTHQKLYAFQGKTLVLQTYISSGKWNPTPDGDYYIWIKLRATRMTGGTGPDYYDLPNVPYVMYFYNNQVPKSEGFGLHGAYWHSNFGHPMSHGCINMRIIDAEKLYNWVSPTTTGLTTYATDQDPGTEITITGKAPGL